METIKEFEERTGIKISIDDEQLQFFDEAYFVLGKSSDGFFSGTTVYGWALQLLNLSLTEFIQLYSLPEIEDTIKNRKKEQNEWNKKVLKFVETTGIAVTTFYKHCPSRLCVKAFKQVEGTTETISKTICFSPEDIRHVINLGQDEFTSYILEKLKKSMETEEVNQ